MRLFNLNYNDHFVYGHRFFRVSLKTRAVLEGFSAFANENWTILSNTG